MADGPESTFRTDLARVRLVLMRELETISVYEALAREADSPEARAFFEHLAAEEKEHVAEATWLLRKLDPGQREFMERAFSEAHFTGALPEKQPVPISGPPATERQPPAPHPFIPEDYRLPTEPGAVMHAIPAPPLNHGAFTVGSLKNRR